MNLKKACIFLLLISSGLLPTAIAQDWEKEMETEEGIEVFTRMVEGQPLKEVKITFQKRTALAPLVCLITNPDKYTDFVYNSISYSRITGDMPGDGIFYGQLDFPWPLSDRDFYVATQMKQDPISKKVTIDTKSVDQQAYDAVDGYVRITSHHNTWNLTPDDNGIIHGEYWLSSNPSGTIPQWAINMMIHEGSVKTIQQLLEQVEDYVPQENIAFIKER